MSEFLYEVGDEYEGSPILASKFISEVLAVGGLVEVDGEIVRIVYLPASVHGNVQVLDRYKDELPASEKVPEPTPEPETLSVVEDLAPIEEAVVEEEPKKTAPKRRGRPRKTEAVEEG